MTEKDAQPVNAAKMDVADETVLWSMVARRAATTPDRTMLVDEHGRSLTFADVAAEAERVAAGLFALGVRAGGTVSWQLPTRIDTVVLSLALARLGAVQNPIIPVYRGREVGAMVRQCGAEWFVTVESFRGFDHGALARELAEASGGTLRLLVLSDGLPHGDVSTLPPPPRRDDEVRWIYTTSGTTSAPKGVCHSDASLIAGGKGLAGALDLGTADVGTILFPYAHIGGPDMLVMTMATGIPAVLMEAFDPAIAMPLLRRHGATISGGGTAFYAMFLHEQRKCPGTPLVPTLRALAGGGAPMPPHLFGEIQAEIGIPVLHGYGMTECPMITQGSFQDGAERLATTVGKPVSGCEVEVRAPDGSTLGPQEQGEVWVRGPMLFAHYLVDGKVTRPHDANGWFPTGDIGFVRLDGHLVLVGRSKDLIIRKGESISPQEIEEVLVQHPAVRDVAVIGIPDPVRGERICAVLELVLGASAPGVAGLKAHCAEEGLSPFKAPEQVEVVDVLPRTPTMKTRKQQLREKFSGLAETGRSPRPSAHAGVGRTAPPLTDIPARETEHPGARS